MREIIVSEVTRSTTTGRFHTVSALHDYGDIWSVFDYFQKIAEECKCNVSFNRDGNTFIFTPKDNPSIEDVSWRAGFEAAKKVAIICARQAEHYNLYEPRGCKAVQNAIEHMMAMNPDRFNHDGTPKPEPTVEYDRAKHGPLLNGKVQR